ncbi:unnamed protein product [Chondrus crispus]|uniref:Uncharacterized protein n=1 Tax=Chondrus crispus TaxID=2769 RepID=R7Q7M8_CHOCR|nr:unnamed protein product [Chondrus crispus]CDF34014.1 unnamed protein product [Chondrus crispus]|eukprot:XP_005713833.1 unnamed protein product [Chondrus crispus]
MDSGKGVRKVGYSAFNGNRVSLAYRWVFSINIESTFATGVGDSRATLPSRSVLLFPCLPLQLKEKAIEAMTKRTTVHVLLLSYTLIISKNIKNMQYSDSLIKEREEILQ